MTCTDALWVGNSSIDALFSVLGALLQKSKRVYNVFIMTATYAFLVCNSVL